MIEDDEETRREREQRHRREQRLLAIFFGLVTWLSISAADIGGLLRGFDGAGFNILLGAALVFGVVGAYCVLLEILKEPSDPARRLNHRR